MGVTVADEVTRNPRGFLGESVFLGVVSLRNGVGRPGPTVVGPPPVRARGVSRTWKNAGGLLSLWSVVLDRACGLSASAASVSGRES